MTRSKQPEDNKPEPREDDSLPWELENAHSGALLDFKRLMRGAAGFSLILLQYNDLRYRDKLLPYLNRYAKAPGTLRLEPKTDFPAFEQQLFILSGKHDLIQVLGLNEWLAEGSRNEKLLGFNYHRELIAEKAQTTLAFWMTENDIRDFVLQAPDMWAWRKGVIDFSIVKQIPAEVERSPIDLNNDDSGECRRRMEEIEAWLAEHSEETVSRANLLRELGQIQLRSGLVENALQAFFTARDIFRQQDDKRDKAFVIGDIARIYVDKGDVDQGLKLHEERLQVYEKLGDIDGIAHTLWSIAKIDLQNKQHQKAHLSLTKAYDLFLKLGHLEGICFVGLDLGQLLCDMGKKKKGVEILRRSESGLRTLGREGRADQVKEMINSLQ
jgi:Tetratricopeptide repeat